MAAEIDHIEIVPDKFGWSVRVYTNGVNFEKHDIGDAMQWVHETERTLGRWLADGPADFHQHDEIHDMTESYERDADYWRSINPDLRRDLERGK